MTPHTYSFQNLRIKSTPQGDSAKILRIKKGSSVELTIQSLLQSWGRDRELHDGDSLGFAPMSIYAREMRNSGQWASKSPPLSEDEHMRVDAEVSALKLRKGRRYKAIVLAYVAGFRDQDLGKYFHCSTSTAREARIAGENWLEARLL